MEILGANFTESEEGLISETLKGKLLLESDKFCHIFFQKIMSVSLFNNNLQSTTSMHRHSGQALLRTLSPKHFDHRDEAYSLSIKEKTMLNHI